MLYKNILAALAVASFLHAEDVIEESEYCSINWSSGYIHCQGESAGDQKKFRAKRAAVVVAQRNLLELIKGVSIDSQTTVKDGMLQSDVIKSSVSGMIKGAEIVSNKYDRDDGSSIATVKIHMGKDLRQALSNGAEVSNNWNKKIQNFFASINFGPTSLNAKEEYSLKDQHTIEKLIKDFQESKDNISLGYLKEILKDVKNKNYSGLLIDAREVGDIKPALTIKLVDKKGKEIYPGKFVDSSAFIGKNGVSVGLDFDIEDARNNQRVFSTPLELKAQSTYKMRKSDIVLSDDAIKKINVTLAALKKAKVIVVVPD